MENFVMKLVKGGRIKALIRKFTTEAAMKDELLQNFRKKLSETIIEIKELTEFCRGYLTKNLMNTTINRVNGGKYYSYIHAVHISI